MLTCTTCHKQIKNPVEQVNVVTDRGSQWCIVCATVRYLDGKPLVLPMSKGQCVEIVSLPRYYSGGMSGWFWEQVAKIRNKEDQGTVYFAGVLLQEMEDRVIHLLEQVRGK